MNALDLSEAGPAVLPLAQIRIDPELQCRAKNANKQTVKEYAEAMKEGASFPPVIVFKDSRGVYWLSDGFTRCEAKALISEDGAGEIAVDIREGSRKDALLFAAGCNANHGLRRTQACKRRAVELLLREPAWAKRTDAWIAKAAAVSAPTVAKLRSTLNISSDGPRETSDGRVMATDNIGSRKPVTDPTEQAMAKFRSILALVPDADRARFAELVLAMLTAPSE